jgi:monovalent cation:H+ antiporter-2, CPA2 family
MHNLGLITTLASALTVALVLGFITHRLKLSPILGYLVAGICIGPHTPGFIADLDIAAQFAEIGVVLLMFGVGLHFRVKDLVAVKSIAVPGAIVQSLIAAILGAGLAMSLGWNLVSGLVLGLAIAVASTVVLMRALVDHNLLQTPHGHVAVGWLIVEDIFTVFFLVMLPSLADIGSQTEESGAMSTLWAAGEAILKVGLLGVLVLFGGSRVIPKLLIMISRTRSGELFTLAVLVLALVIAAGSALIFGVSMALGAFLAGMVVGRSEVSHQAAANALPMRDAFAVLFFVSVGMLFDPRFLIAQPVLVLGTLAIILLAKPLAALIIVLALGYSVRTGLIVAIGLAQIGEFSFIIADAALDLGILPLAGQSALVAAALISIAANPLLFRILEPIEKWIERHERLRVLLNRRAEARGKSVNLATEARIAADPEINAIVVGYGPVGQTVSGILRDFGLRTVILDLNVDTIRELVAQGHTAFYGDAGREEILKAAGVAKAQYLIVTLPELMSRIPIIVEARLQNPEIKILVRARYLSEQALLEEIGATAVCYEEAEAAVALAAFLLQEICAAPSRIEVETNKIRKQFAIRSWRSLLANNAPTSQDPPQQ